MVFEVEAFSLALQFGAKVHSWRSKCINNLRIFCNNVLCAQTFFTYLDWKPNADGDRLIIF